MLWLFQYNFTVTVDTRRENKTANLTLTENTLNTTVNDTEEIELPVVYEVPEELM